MSEASTFSSLLRANLKGHFVPAEDLAGRLEAHYQLLCRWNRALNLTTVTSLAGAVVRHYCESMFLGLQLPASPISVLDVGSGPGFPGLAIAFMRPDCQVVLAESHQRKAVFLREASRGVANIRVHAGRAESLNELFDWVVSRAVRWEEVLPLVSRSTGLLIGAEDAADASRERGFEWQTVPLPWGKRRVAVIGRRRDV